MSSFMIFSETAQRTPDPSVRLMRFHGCDGTCHVDAIVKEYLDEGGEHDFAESFGEVVIGPCDGSCGPPKEGEGGFIFPTR